MYQTSDEYKEAMKKPIRNHSYMIVTLGVINQDAQRSASVSDQDKYIDFSNFSSVFNESWNGNHYATYEKDFFKVDGSMVFLPDDVSDCQKNGLISERLFSGEFKMKFTFGCGKVDIKGLTIQFVDNYPTKFLISTDSGAVTQYENDSAFFETDTVFENTAYIEITITEMKYSNGRVRLNYVKFGIGLEFDNEDIKSAESKSTLSVIDDDLPQIDFSVTVCNNDQVFDVDNPESVINFFEPGQALNVSYGYELDDGNIEWIKAHSIYLSEWKADNKQAVISAVDRFQIMNDSYYKGKYYDNGISLYDLAESVLLDAGIESDEYAITNYLKEIKVKNPIPNVGHKEALQIIANAGMCVLGYDRDGKIQIYQDSNSDTGYRIGFDDLFEHPVGNQLEKIKELRIARTRLTKSTTLEELMSDTFSYDGNNITYFFESPCYGYTVSVEASGSATIVSSGSYYIEISIDGADVGEEITVLVKGYRYNESSSYYAVSLNNRGSIKEWQNPIVSDLSHAKKIAEWLSGYYSSAVEYDLDFRGEPALDAGDTISQENKYNDNLNVVIEEIQLKFEQSIRSNLKTRRK